MYPKQVPFQLETTVPGTFLMQGLLGGLLGGFVAAFVGGIAWSASDLWSALNIASIAVFISAITSLVKATCIWGLYRLTGIQMRALARVALVISGSFLFVAVLRFLEFEGKFLSGCLIWLLSVGPPVALLVGSRIKPWEVFTFGSIAGGALDQRSGSNSILGMLGTLPLRFLSITALVVLLLYSTTQFTKVHDADDVLVITLFLSIVCLYPLFSAYVTFRSPRKMILIILGVALNLPFILLILINYRLYLQPYPSRWPKLISTVICGSFIVAWVIFLFARLTVRTSSASLSISQTPEHLGNLDHQCLGSRFVDWQQRVA